MLEFLEHVGYTFFLFSNLLNGFKKVDQRKVRRETYAKILVPDA